jgi:hypothetical protein
MATLQNISFDQGADFGMTIAVTDANGDPADLSSATIFAQIRSVSHSLITPFTVAVTGINHNVLNLYVSGATSGAVPAGASRWDCFVLVNSIYYKVAYGDCFINEAQSEVS